MSDGREVFQYTLSNKNNISVGVINYGGIITSIVVPDRNGKFEDIALGFDTLEDYKAYSPYFGAIIGRYGNRIGNGRFTIDGTEYHVAQNNNGQHLHGGLKGFDKVYWTIEPFDSDEGAALKLTYLSPDGEEGYPGNLSVEVIYLLTDGNEFKILISATTDKKTIVNLTTHSYFNLLGNAKRDILDHQIQLFADQFVPVSSTLIPTGKLESVGNTPFDFRTPHTIGEGIDSTHEQVQLGLGYDHTWVTGDVGVKKKIAVAYEPTTGRELTVYSTEPGVQFYTGNFLNGAKGKNGVVYPKRYGFCLEPQHFPDSPNKADFPTVILKPGERFHTETVYKFSTR
ncbi:galactose-1-epimerase [Pseudochryseolinea flava]|uniref:Aldose 1-epimerase n=2 Tax=Pseudochryseolinea flava TaxID=2059302 RepID=A0A364Y7V8_9BACT|nr:galactose-1-epimerase [Pseudochryseolinea flava]